MGVRGERARIVRRWLPIAVACLAVSLLPVSPVSAAEEPAGADEPASDALAAAETVPDDAAGGVEVVRYAGSDQYELSLAVSQALVDAAGGISEWAVLASGESWADAATAGPLAASLGAPVVLVPPGGLQTPTARPDLVEFLRSTGVRRVVIVGGADVLPNHEPSVLYGLGMLPRNIERVHGDDPVGSAIAVAERIGAPAEFGELGRTVLIVSDQSMADAVAVGPLAAAGPFPLLLTAPGALNPRIAAYLTEHEVTHAVLVGGTAAIAPAVEEALETAGTAVTRLAGRDRSATARLAAELTEQHTADDPACADGPIRLGLVPAQSPEQALTAGPLLAALCTPLRYTDTDQLSSDLHNTLYLARHRPEGSQAHVFAGAEQVSDASINSPLTRKPPLRIAFVSGTQVEGRPTLVIAIIDENRSMVLHLEDQGIGGIKGLRWSPDGRHLAYEGIQDGTWGLFVLDTFTGHNRRLTPPAQQFRFSTWAWPVWSPDGNHLAMSAFVDTSPHGTDADGEPMGANLYVAEVGAGTLRQLTKTPLQDHFWSWSPDSRRIIFGRHGHFVVPLGSDGSKSGDEFLLAHLESGAITQIDPAGQRIGRWLWSPDGEQAALELVSPNEEHAGTPDVYRASLSALPDLELVDTGHDGYIQGWSDDGQLLAMRSDYHAEGYFWFLDPEFEAVSQLQPHEIGSPGGDVIFRGWSPDSHRALLVKYGATPGSTRELLLIDAATGDHTALPLEAGTQLNFGGLSFAPDGTQIVASVNHLESWRIAVQAARHGSLPVELIDISEYTPVTDGITSVSVHWTANGIVGAIGWHSDY